MKTVAHFVEAVSISAQVDSNGKAVKMSAPSWGKLTSSKPTPQVGDLWRHPAMSRTVQVTEVTPTHVQFIDVNRDGSSKDGSRANKLTHNQFFKNHNKQS